MPCHGMMRCTVTLYAPFLACMPITYSYMSVIAHEANLYMTFQSLDRVAQQIWDL